MGFRLSRISALVLAGFLFGCGEEPYQVELLRVEEPRQGTDSCFKAGMCYTCAPGLDGTMNCGIKLSGACPGYQSVMRQTSVYKLYFKEKDPEIEEVTKTVQILTQCY